MEKWVVRADREKDDNGSPLYWVMDFGWGSLDTATIFNNNKGLVWLGGWQTLSDAKKEVESFDKPE